MDNIQADSLMERTEDFVSIFFASPHFLLYFRYSLVVFDIGLDAQRLGYIQIHEACECQGYNKNDKKVEEDCFFQVLDQTYL